MTGKRIKFILFLIPFRYYFHMFVLIVLFVDFLKYFPLPFFYFPLLFGKYKHIVNSNEFGKHPSDFYFPQKIFSIFFTVKISSDIFLSSFKTPRQK